MSKIRRAVDRSPVLAFVMAKELGKLGMADQAMEILDSGLDKAPHNVELLHSRRELLHALGKHDEAILQLEEIRQAVSG